MGNGIGHVATSVGEIWEAQGHFRLPDGARYVNINMSEIFTILIQEAGRWCESYASDLLHDIDAVRNALERPDEWEDIKGFQETADGGECLCFRFGFRRYGVDHSEYIESAMKNEHEKHHYYRSIWELTIQKDAETHNRVRATLRRVA